MTADGVHGVAAASDPDCEALEELQFTLGEGPCIDAFSLRRPVLEPDLASASAGRWPGYRAAAQEAGVRAVFAFPLQVGAALLGVLDVHRRASGILSPEALMQALTFAEVTVETLLEGQERALPGEAETTLNRALDSQFTIYQAQGMAMVDLRVSLADAMARLQGHAFAHDRRLQDVAGDVVAGRLRLEPDPP
jgi:GAF domain-containing protein